jgi:hypothetical protein
MRRREWLLVVVATALGSCGGGEGGGAASPGPPTVSGLTFAVTPILGLGGSRVELAWTTSGATTHRVHIGRSTGADDVGVIDTGNGGGRFAWDAPAGRYFVRVAAVNERGEGPPSSEVVMRAPDPREMIVAAFLGLGPMAVPGDGPGGPGCTVGLMKGWGPGPPIQVLAGSSVPATGVAVLRETAAQWPQMSNDFLRAEVGTVAEPEAAPAFRRISAVVLSSEEVQSRCGCDSCGGCAVQRLSASGRRIEFTSVTIIVLAGPAASTWAHELGHAFGLCHVAVLEEFKPDAVMSYGDTRGASRLRESEVRAGEATYAAGLRTGARTADFGKAGLLPASVAASARSSRDLFDPRTGALDVGALRASLPRGFRLFVLSEDEIEIVKPLCELPEPAPELGDGPG